MAVGFWIFESSFSAGLESLDESGFVDPNTVVENRGTMSYAAIAVPIVIVLEIVVLILVFVIKPRQLKPVGIFLIVVSAQQQVGTEYCRLHYFYLQVY